MRKILKIAKLELSILFYSPVAWLVLSIFMIQCGLSFLDNLQSISTSLGLGYQTRPITGTLFGDNAGLFTVIQSNLYLYLPILTMGLMSRETSSGSIKLLLSSPVKLSEIILGKYLAIIGYGLMLILVLMVFAFIGFFSIPYVDAGRIISGLFGLYMLICTYAAIGLYMSCLTTYQVVAAISTLAVFAMLRFVGSLGQNIDFVRDLTYFLSISGRTDKMIAGLITTRDVMYYLIIISSFLALCVLRLKSERELKSWTVKTGRYVGLICMALLMVYVTSRPAMTGYLDVTRAKSLTLTKKSQEIAGQIKGALKVTTYVNMLAPAVWNLLPVSRNGDLSRLEQFKRFMPGMTVNYQYYYEKPLDSNFADYRYNPNLKGITNTDKIAEQMAINMDIDGKLFVPSKKMTNLSELKSEGFMNVRKLEYNEKSTYIRFYVGPGEQDSYPSEAEFMAAVKRLLVKAPKVVFLAGDNERSIADPSDRGYSMVTNLKTRRNALINQGFDIDTLNLNNAEIAADVDILVLADPTLTFSPAARQKLAAYLQKGGNMLITGDSERRDILNPLLQPLGIQLKAGTLVKGEGKFTPDFISALVNQQAKYLDSNLNRLSHYAVGVALQGAAPLEYSVQPGFTVYPVLMSPETGWIKSGKIDPTVSILRYDAAAGDQQGSFPVSLSLIRKLKHKEQRILVSGDADFMSNGELNRGKRGENEYYLQGIFRWLSNNMFPIDVKRPDPKDMTVSVSREQITVMKYICRGIIPALIAVFGAIILFKRRRN